MIEEETNFQDWFKDVKFIDEIPPIPKNLDTKHLQEFINEFNVLKDGDNK